MGNTNSFLYRCARYEIATAMQQPQIIARRSKQLSLISLLSTAAAKQAEPAGGAQKLGPEGKNSRERF